MSFDRLAPAYSTLEWVLAGSLLQQCRTAFLHHARMARSILLVGEGHGRALEAVLEINPAAAVTCVDASAGMLDAARKRLERRSIDTSNVNFVQAEVFTFAPRERCDLLATNFFLDCFTAWELDRLVPHLAGMLNPEGVWLISDFAIPRGKVAAIRARLVLRLAYTFFRVTTNLPARNLVSPEPLLLRNGLERLDRKTMNFGLLYTEAWRKR